MLAGCTSAPPSPAPVTMYTGCPTARPCPIPPSQPGTNGDLSADIRRLEAALIDCGLQVEALQQCQEAHHAETTTPTPDPA
ncbi:Rz1-like lysis system protein LysC [Chimaeribacter californicus]|uniref:Rz1-like lysis system protein LysC n=1 Tax=Chimaeribacter californicus TaxID=2060067 RepID=UPI001F4D5524|nr:Rz1-like lysis system protein LysC [Chimaeribacter californicus]